MNPHSIYSRMFLTYWYILRKDYETQMAHYVPLENRKKDRHMVERSGCPTATVRLWDLPPDRWVACWIGELFSVLDQQSEAPVAYEIAIG